MTLLTVLCCVTDVVKWKPNNTFWTRLLASPTPSSRRWALVDYISLHWLFRIRILYFILVQEPNIFYMAIKESSIQENLFSFCRKRKQLHSKSWQIVTWSEVRSLILQRELQWISINSRYKIENFCCKSCLYRNCCINIVIYFLL